MTASFEPEITGRLQRALVAFQKAQGMLLTAHRKLKDLPSDEVNRFPDYAASSADYDEVQTENYSAFAEG
jgi:hypothetical protein